MEDFKFNIDETVYYDSIISKYKGKIISRKIKEFGIFKRKMKNTYLVKDSDSGLIFEFCEESLWKLQ
jgi:hypothetical protein